MTLFINIFVSNNVNTYKTTKKEKKKILFNCSVFGIWIWAKMKLPSHLVTTWSSYSALHVSPHTELPPSYEAPCLPGSPDRPSAVRASRSCWFSQYPHQGQKGVILATVLEAARRPCSITRMAWYKSLSPLKTFYLCSGLKFTNIPLNPPHLLKILAFNQFLGHHPE